MEDKIAFVFDTNFIVQEKNLDKVLENLKEKFSVYVPQICIDERIAQECRDLRKLFDEVEDIQRRCAKIASVNFETSYERKAAEVSSGMQKKYEKWFGNHIIPFSKDATTFQMVLDRAYQKLPPFLDEKNASDKGFKDALVWISLLEYFTKSGSAKVIFVTSDNGFSRNTDWLCEEFHKVTGKTIEIKNNTYYGELLKDNAQQSPPPTPKQRPDFSHLREEISSVLDALCGFETEDYWGNQQYEYRFFLNQIVDAAYMKAVFDNLGEVIENHLFDQSISADSVLELDDRVINGEVNISLGILENVMKLYEKMKKDYPDYIQQFYLTAANIINRNYREPPKGIDEDDFNLPF